MITKGKRSAIVAACAAASVVAGYGCGGGDGGGGSQMEPFSLGFAATAGGTEVGCTDTIVGLGPDGEDAAGISDLRFYISNLRFEDASGNPVDVVLDENEFQLHGDAGFVGLIDLTGNTEGTCSNNAIAFGEGTGRTNSAITGTTRVDDVATVSFDVGVSQAVMQEVIAENTIEGAPSPLNEMYWSWASGYRHFVFNFVVDAPGSAAGEGYVHVGSRDCGPADGRALEDRDRCDFVNTPTVSLGAFDLDSDRVQVDLARVLSGLDFVSPIYDQETFEIIGEGPGVECHSSPMQPDCSTIFSSFGVSPSGESSAAANSVFSVM